MADVSCAACGHLMTPADRFCTGCGKAAAAAQSASGFQWKWAALSIPIVIATTIACLFGSGFVCASMGVDPEVSRNVVAFPAFTAGMFTGGLLAGFLSPARTVFEPGVGIAATLVGLNLLMGESSGILSAWILPFGIGSLGAALGEWLQRLRNRGSGSGGS